MSGRHRVNHTARLGLATAVVGLLALPLAGQEPGSDAVVESGLVEQAGRRLVQLDVTVTGPKDEVATLERDDFELIIGGRPIRELTVDNLCALEVDGGPSPTGETHADAAEPTPVPPPRPAAHFLFYFDQVHLTQAGRQFALEDAKALIPRLIVNGDRGTIVSSGREMRTFADMTDDVDRLVTAVDEVGRDPMQWDPKIFGSNDRNQIREVLDLLSKGALTEAMSRARIFQRDESWRAKRALQRFAIVIGRMADLDPPKAVIYFADSMRRNAGEHYVELLSWNDRLKGTVTISKMSADAAWASNPFDRLLEEATAHGVRVYTIQAEGLVTIDPTLAPLAPNVAAPSVSTRHITDAQNTLVSLAHETGAEAFLNGVRPAKIARRIQADLSCLYLLSFDAEGLPLDSNLTVGLRTRRKKIKTQIRGLLVVQSESRRQTSRLMAAFAAPDAVKQQDIQAAGSVIPTGFTEGRYTALVQFSIPPSPMIGATWDLGMSLVSRSKVREDASGRITVNGQGVPVLFETEMQFKPGPYEIIAVGHESQADQIATHEIEGNWPDPDDAPATVAPIALLQPFDGLILRDTELKRSGAVGLAEHDLARTTKPTALVSLVCRGKTKGKLRVERSLVGETPAPFDPVDVELAKDKERCVQVRDMIPAGVMGAGMFTYQIRVFRKTAEVAQASRRFAAIDDETATLGEALTVVDPLQ